MKKTLLLFILFCFPKVFGQNDCTLNYTNGNAKIELKTNSKKCVIKANETNRIIIRVKNIDVKTMACSAPGLTFKGPLAEDKNETLWEVNWTNPEKLRIYKFRFAYSKGGQRFTGLFEIPVE